MKKSIIVLGLALAAVSCNINEPKPFDDKDAFAAFPTAAVSVAENGGSVSVPVHLTSLSGVATSVSYTIKDGSAVQGKDFEVIGGTGVINFAAGESEKTIDFKVIDFPGVFTGDKSFTIELTSAGDVALGAATSAKVTISDLDHPLSKILGTYTGSYADYWGDEYDAEITFKKDASDLSMVWIYGICPYFNMNGYPGPVYGIVNEDMTQIAIPQEQSIGYSTAIVVSADTDGDIIFSISPDGKTITFENLFGVYLPGSGWYSLYVPGTQINKVD